MKAPSLFPLESGDGVEVIAPSYPVSNDVVSASVSLIESWGLTPNVRLTQKSPHHPLYADEDEERFKNLQTALCSTQAKVIWVLQGGAGATRLLPALSAWARSLSSSPPKKLLIGFSDVTALHTFFRQQWGWPVLHAPNLRGIVTSKIEASSIQALREILFGCGKHGKIMEEKDLLPLNDAARQSTLIEAAIVGGNHSVLQYGIGTPWQIDCRDKILFLEDVNERAYRVDLRLEHFCQAGLLEGVKAILFGDFSYSAEPVSEHVEENPDRIEYVLKSFAERMTVPVLKMSGYGHTSSNKPLLMGVQATLRNGTVPGLPGLNPSLVIEK